MMTDSEFLKLAEKNNAVIPPDESEKHRQSTEKMFDGLRSDWLGSSYYIDTDNPVHVFADKTRTGILFFGAVLGMVLLLPYLFLAVVSVLTLLSKAVGW